MIYIPDGLEEQTAVARTTHLAIAAHQDDIEFMAYAPIAECFGSSDKWFGAVVVTDGAGSPRSGIYADYTDEEMKEVRIVEQKKAAFVGEYSFLALLGIPRRQSKKGNARSSKSSPLSSKGRSPSISIRTTWPINTRRTLRRRSGSSRRFVSSSPRIGPRRSLAARCGAISIGSATTRRSFSTAARTPTSCVRFPPCSTARSRAASATISRRREEGSQTPPSPQAMPAIPTPPSTTRWISRR